MIYEVEVLECNSGVSKKGRAYNVALVRLEGRVGKIFSDVPLVPSSEKVKVDVVIQPNAELFLSPAIKRVETV